MNYLNFLENKYYVIIIDNEVISHGEIEAGQTLTTSHNYELYDKYDDYTYRLRQFAIHLNLDD